MKKEYIKYIDDLIETRNIEGVLSYERFKILKKEVINKDVSAILDHLDTKETEDGKRICDGIMRKMLGQSYEPTDSEIDEFKKLHNGWTYPHGWGSIPSTKDFNYKDISIEFFDKFPETTKSIL